MRDSLAAKEKRKKKQKKRYDDNQIMYDVLSNYELCVSACNGTITVIKFFRIGLKRRYERIFSED